MSTRPGITFFRTAAGLSGAAEAPLPDALSWGPGTSPEETPAAGVVLWLPKATVAYTLRHSTITDLIVSGADPLTVSKIAGTSMAMIDKTYGHLVREHARDALQVLAR